MNKLRLGMALTDEDFEAATATGKRKQKVMVFFPLVVGSVAIIFHDSLKSSLKKFLLGSHLFVPGRRWHHHD